MQVQWKKLFKIRPDSYYNQLKHIIALAQPFIDWLHNPHWRCVYFVEKQVYGAPHVLIPYSNAINRQQYLIFPDYWLCVAAIWLLNSRGTGNCIIRVDWLTFICNMCVCIICCHGMFNQIQLLASVALLLFLSCWRYS